MDDLNAKITQILQDPSRIQQIMEIASSMGLSPPTEETDSTGVINPEALEQINQMFHHAEAKEKRQETLFKALLPYLKPNRQARLERAMQLSHLSRLAGAAFRNQAFPFIPTQEDSHHV